MYLFFNKNIITYSICYSSNNGKLCFLLKSNNTSLFDLYDSISTVSLSVNALYIITGSTIFSSDSGSLPSGFVSGSEPTGSSEIVVEGDIEVSGSIIENYTNNVPISASILLTTALHGQGRQLFVRSGSAAIDATTGGGGLPAGLPVGNGIYKSTQPAGNMIITLPSASVGMSFHIINHNSPSNMAPFIGKSWDFGGI